jgi:1-acyl-sn-glycerol-3-phosphate acyltransferase
MRVLDRGWRIFATGLSFSLFGLYALLLALTICPLVAVCSFNADTRSRRVQLVVHKACGHFIGMLTALGLLRCEIIGREHLEQAQGRLIVANHPSLIDAVFLLSWLPQADCIVKQALTVNPLLRWTVAWAGYIGNAAPDELVVRCADKLRAGRTLIIFPEGTRTVPGRKAVFRRGAARVALLSEAEVTPVQIRCEPTTLIKGERWWQVPERPPRYRFMVGEPFSIARFKLDASAHSSAARRLTHYLEAVLVPAPAACPMPAQAKVAALSLS